MMKTNVEIRFHATDIPGGADTILGPSGCGPDVVKLEEYTWMAIGGMEHPGVKVEITLDEHDDRIAKVLALLDQYGEERWVRREDVYTENELQAAPLLVVIPWGHVRALGVATYDESKACPRCKTGGQQTSTQTISGRDWKQTEKLRIAGTIDGDVLVNDVDVERLLAAGVTGALFWPVNANTRPGCVEETRRQQTFPQHVMLPMSAKSLVDRTKVCPDCGRGCFLHVMNYPMRFVYRREDLANIQDINLTWEWFGEPPSVNEHGLGAGPRHPWVLVTPKVMNLLRGKTKKEQKYQGCNFTPIWIDDDTHDKPYVLT